MPLSSSPRGHSLVRQVLPRFHGREVKTIGDAFLVDFPSALDASRCAVEMQRRVQERNESEAGSESLLVRIGIHVGDVERRGEDIFCDAVNICSRVQVRPNPVESASRGRFSTRSGTNWTIMSARWGPESSRT